MPEADQPVPRLDFATGVVGFPHRGGQIFLPVSNPLSPLFDDPPATQAGVWLLHTGSGMSVLIPQRTRVVRDGAVVVGMAVLHHGETVGFGGLTARFADVRRMVLDEASLLVGRRCPSCHVAFTAAETVICCPLCREGYHTDCWDEMVNTHCYSQNCRFAPGRFAPGRIESAAEHAESREPST